LRRAGAPLPQVPVVVIRDGAARQALRAATAIRVSARMGAPAVEPVTLRNVVGVLRGAEGPLRDSYLLLTAHYDHLGLRAAGSGDRIYNGANDNASGSAALVEIARALSSLPSPPARSIIFAALFGEENGALGSRYYVERPPIPLEKTVADINLEQLGRTDDTEGAKLLQFNLTGYGFSTLGEQFAKVAPECGVQVVNDRKRGDEYFERSDNISFSRAGMPSTTVSVSYEFPDYHGLGDEWPKISYNNMQQVACGIAVGVLSIANLPDPPHWNSGNQKSRRYIK
jgi:Zn-dependent M28 family amino/carboxypeptidase